MPASGRGANLDLSRRIGAPRAKPPVPSTARPTSSTNSANLRAPVSTHPFQQAVTQSAQAVARATPRPAAKVPILPRVANPTPAQTHAALQLIHKTASRAIGPNPTPQSVAAYQRELHSNPSNADFVKSIEHYTAAAQQHVAQAAASAAAALGQRAAGSGLLSPKALTPLQKLVSGAENDAETTSVNSRNAAIGRGEADAPKLKESLHLPGATIDISPLVGAIANAHIAPKGVIGNVINEAIDLPGQSFLSGAVAGTAARHAVEGKPQELEQLGKSTLSQIEHPIRSFEEAPLSTALIFAGGEGAVGRLAGGVGRGLVKAGAIDSESALARAVSKARPDLKLYGDEALTNRTYNADPARAAVQKLYEKVLPKLPGDLRQADPHQAEGWRLRRNLVGTTFKPGAVDYIRAGGEHSRRVIVKGDVQRVDEAKPKVGAHAVSLIVQRVIRSPATLTHDLEKEAAKLRAVQPELKGSERAANRANLAHAEALLADKKFLADPSEAFKAAKRVIEIQKPHTAGKLAAGTLDEEQLRASLFPYAQAHMSGKYFTVAEHQAAEADALAGGNNDLAARVSGRGDPEGVHLHEQAQSDHAAAKAERSQAQEQVRRAENARSRLVGAYGRPRSQDEALHLGAAEGAVGGRMAAAEANLTGAKEALRAATAREADARAVAAIPKPAINAGLRHATGEYLPNEEILAHMAAHGVEPPGFVSHRTGVGGRSSYYKSTLRQPTLERFNRTGASFAKGTADHSWEALRGTIARQASERAQGEVRTRELNRLAVGPSYETAADAQAAADNFHATRQGDPVEKLGRLQVVHLGSSKIVEKGHVVPTAATSDVLKQFGLEEHTTPPVAEQGRYALIPEQVMKRMSAHDEALKTNSDRGRAMQLYQQSFRRAKLNTSPRHIAGVAQEQGIRLAFENLLPAHTIGSGKVTDRLRISGATVGGRAGRAGAQVEQAVKRLAEVDEHGHLADSNGPLGAKFRQLEASIGRHGGVASSSRENDVVRQGDQFAQSSAMGYILHGSEAAAKTRVGEAIAKPWRAYRATIEGGLSKVEHGTYNAMLGKALKQSGFIDSYREVLKAQDEGVQALVAGRMTPQMADSIARRVDDMMGNWTHQTPAVRTLIGKFAPFGLWWLNSMRWLYRLPVTHPVKSGILGALYNATREDRNSKGQGFDAKSPVPSFLSGAIDAHLPFVGPVQVQPSYYSPGGTLGPEAFNTALEQFVPALQGIGAAAQGVNPLSHAKLTNAEKKELGPLQIGTNVAAEATAGPVPFATQLQQLAQKGGKPYGTANWITDLLQELGGPAQTKPGTERPLSEVLTKILSPVRFAYQKPGTSTGAATSAPSSGSDGESVYDRRLRRSLERASSAGDSSTADRRLQRSLERSR